MKLDTWMDMEKHPEWTFFIWMQFYQSIQFYLEFADDHL